MRWRKRRRDADFAEEIRAHLELEEEAHRARGLSASEARMAARRAFGNQTAATERFHESRRGAGLEAGWRSIRQATRSLTRAPGVTVAAVVALAFGIGVNSALFTVLYSILVRPVPGIDPSGLVGVGRRVAEVAGYGLEVNGRASMLSYPDYLALRDGTRTVEQLAVYRQEPLTLSGERSQAIQGELVSCNYFAAVRVPMSAGRAFVPDDCSQPGQGRVVVLANRYWRTEFGADSTLVGRSIVLDRISVRVIGVAGPSFGGMGFDETGVWMPVTMYPALHPTDPTALTRDLSWLAAVGRLREGAGPAAAQSELTTLSRAQDARWPGRTSTITLTKGTRLTDPEDRAIVTGLVAAMTTLGGLVLLMTCANVMSLLLGRAAARRREIAIRVSLGASRSRLVGQLMVESALLAALGGGAGLVLAYLLPPLIRVALPTQAANLVFTPNGSVVAATAVVALGAALLSGLIPALQSTDLQLTEALKNEAPAGPRGTWRWRNRAVGVQVAASGMLLIAAALVLRGAQRSLAVDPGFRIEGVNTLTLNLPQVGYDGARAAAFVTELEARLEAMPGVGSVGAAMLIPLRGRGETQATPVTGGADAAGRTMPTLFNSVSGSYFGTVGIRLVRGRAFDDHEAGDDPMPAVVSSAFARTAWGADDPIGRRITSDGRHLVVVGVAADVQSITLGVPDGPYLYRPIRPDDLLGKRLVVRADLPTTALRGHTERIVHALDPAVLVEVRSFGEEQTRAIAPIRLAGLFTTGLGLIALLLAAIGVYGVVAFAVSQRQREIGVRMALGATRWSVQGLMFRQGVRPVAVGLVVGVVLALAVLRALRHVLTALGALDAAMIGLVALLLFAVAGLAVAVPAARAARVDPTTTLRAD
jgi:putative ABC transport system permease protein